MMLCRERKFEDLFFRLRSPALDQSCSIRLQQIQGMEQTGIYKALTKKHRVVSESRDPEVIRTINLVAININKPINQLILRLE